MEIYGEDKETGNTYKADSEKVSPEFIKEFSISSISDDDIKKIIDRLDLSADMKNILFKFAKVTIRVGNVILKVGKKIFEFVVKLLKEFPNALFGAIFGLIVGFLISTIPIFGVIVGALVTPLAIIFGMLRGAQEDIKDKVLCRKIKAIHEKFSPLNV